MVKNKVLSACVSLALAAALITPVFAVDDWHPSQTNQGVTQEDTTVTVDGYTFIVTQSEEVYLEGDARILVSNVSASVSDADPTVQANVARTKELYQKALGTTASQFISQNADLSAFEAEAEVLVGKKVSADEFIMASMFDVTPNTEALAIIKKLGGITLTFNVPGITADGKYLAIHFKSDNTTEVLDVTPGNGTATIKFGTDFSPVMILKYSEGASASSSKIVDTGDHSNILVYGIVAGVAIVIAGVAIVIRRKKAEEE